MKKFKLVALLSLCFLTFGCKKTELTGDYAGYVGDWTSDYATLSLKSAGIGTYDYSKEGVTKNVKNGRVIIEGNKLSLKVAFISTNFTINEAPKASTDYPGKMEMILDGETFIRD